MGRKIVLVDDLTQEELKDGEGSTVTFSVNGAFYQMDLSNKSLDKFTKAVQPFVDNAERVTAPAAGPGRGRRAGGQKPATDREQLQAAREWLRAQGHEVSDRGRIKVELMDLYNAAH